MIRVERDAGFWTGVAAHPEVAPRLGPMVSGPALAAYVARPDVLPLAAEHGGFLFARRDRLGFCAELHTLFTPEGWGREALGAAVEAINAVWLCGYQVVLTFEAEANPLARPPASFGFTRAGEWRETPVGRLRAWIVTQDGWRASPAARRRARACH
jgi:hypothetical protein